MADVVYADASASWNAAEDLVLEKYHKDLLRPNHRHGKVLSRVHTPKKVIVDNNGLNFKIKIRNKDSTRITNDLRANFNTPRGFTTKMVKARWNPATPADNDFARISDSLRFEHWDYKGDVHGLVNLVDEEMMDFQEGLDETISLAHWAGMECNIGSVDTETTGKNNDRENIQQAATYSGAGANGLRLKVKNGAISNFTHGRTLRAYDVTAGAYVDVTAAKTGSDGELTVDDFNPVDNTIGISGDATLIDTLKTVMDAKSDVRFYRSQVADDSAASPGTLISERNVGMRGFGAWYEEPTVGEKFIGGIDRTTKDYRGLIPVAINRGGTLRRLEAGDLNSLAVAMGYVNPRNDRVMLVIGAPTHAQALQNDIGQAMFIPWDVRNERLKRFAHLGMSGTLFQHPHFGPTVIDSDPMCPPNKVFVADPTTWFSMHYGRIDWEWIIEPKSGMFYRLQGATGLGKSLTYQADGMINMLSWCSAPRDNGCIENVFGDN